MLKTLICFLFRQIIVITYQNEYNGTEIVLSIVKGIIERHGGHMWVESELGKISTFYFVMHIVQ